MMLLLETSRSSVSFVKRSLQAIMFDETRRLIHSFEEQVFGYDKAVEESPL